MMNAFVDWILQMTIKKIDNTASSRHAQAQTREATQGHENWVVFTPKVATKSPPPPTFNRS